MVNNVIFSHFIITKDRQIVDIIKVNKKTDPNFVSKSKYKNFGIIGVLKPRQTLFPDTEVDKSWIKIGNKIPFNISSHGIMPIKVAHDVLRDLSKKETKERIAEIRKDRDKNLKQKQYNQCINYLNWIQTADAKKVIEDIKKELNDPNYKNSLNELNYRFFHHSFKVYWMRDHIIKKAHQLLRLLNIKSGDLPDEVIQSCIDNDINQLINMILLDTAERFFTMNRNNNNAWVMDGPKLFGNFLILEKSVQSLISFMEETQKQKGVIFGDGNIIGWDEGTIIYLWKPLNLIRWNMGDEVPKILFKKTK